MTSKQTAFTELFVGTLIYAVILGFLNDYTSIVYTDSFSSLFLAALILEMLTYLTFALKKRTLNWLSNKGYGDRKIAIVFAIWLILFVSKFVFIWVIDMLFADAVTIYGFFGILVVAASATLLHKGFTYTFRTLGDANGRKQKDLSNTSF